VLTSCFELDSVDISVHEVFVLSSLRNATRQTRSIALQVVQGSLGFVTTHAYTLAKTARSTMSAFPNKELIALQRRTMWKECDKFRRIKSYRLTFKNSYGGWGHIVYDELSCSYEATGKSDCRMLQCRPQEGAPGGWKRSRHHPGGVHRNKR
jgi:hypothetical protein